MALNRVTQYRLDNSAPAGVSRTGTFGILAGTGSGGPLTSNMTSAGERVFNRANNTAVGRPEDTSVFGWLTPPADVAIDASPGNVVLPARSATLTVPITSTASNALALTAGSATLRMALWSFNPADSSPATLHVAASGAATTTRGLGAATPTVDVNIPEIVLPEGHVLLLGIGALLTAPQPAIGSNTETYTINTATVTFPVTPIRARYPRSAVQAVALPDAQARRQTGTVRRNDRAVPVLGHAASRRLIAARHSFDTTVLAALASRSVLYPRRPATEHVPVPAHVAIRQTTFRRPATPPVLSPAATAFRLTSATRFITAPMLVAATANKQVTYGRKPTEFLQPGEEPVIDPTRKIHTIVRNGDGTLHGAGAYVVLFRTESNFPVQTATTDASSEVIFPRNSFDNQTYFVAAWDSDGTPLSAQAVSERGLVPEAV